MRITSDSVGDRNVNKKKVKLLVNQSRGKERTEAGKNLENGKISERADE